MEIEGVDRWEARMTLENDAGIRECRGLWGMLRMMLYPSNSGKPLLFFKQRRDWINFILLKDHPALIEEWIGMGKWQGDQLGG